MAQDLEAGKFQPEIPGLTLNYSQTLVQTNITGFLTTDMVHTLEHYHPGAAGEMLEMAKAGQQAIIDSNKEAMSRTQTDIRRGQILGFLSIIASIGSSLYSVYLGASPVVSCALAGWAIGKSAYEAIERFKA